VGFYDELVNEKIWIICFALWRVIGRFIIGLNGLKFNTLVSQKSGLHQT
jgi:hypothetical protein